ncbi:MAG: hypothetical protein ACK4Z4_06705, partial [Ferrovibrio sp.]
ARVCPQGHANPPTSAQCAYCGQALPGDGVQVRRPRLGRMRLSTGELIDLGVKANVVEKSGSWLSFDSQRIGQGREAAKAFLKENPEVANRIEAAIKANTGLVAAAIDAGPEGNEAEDAE